MGTDRERKTRENLVNREIFAQHRPRLQAIAYRMLGTIADAEDMVQRSDPQLLSEQSCFATLARKPRSTQGANKGA